MSRVRLKLIDNWNGFNHRVSSVRIRSKLAELIAVSILRATLTSKYPAKILTAEFFRNMALEEKELLARHWNTFDLFKPIFRIVNEIPAYDGYLLYEVKSKVITEKNRAELDIPEFRFSLSQKNFF